VLEPGLTDCGKFTAKPSGPDVDRYASLAQVIDGGDLLGSDRRIPRPRQDRGNDLELFGRGKERVAERYRFMLIFRAVTGSETYLAQRVIEAGVLGDLHQLDVVVDVPAGALLDIAENEPTGHVGHPICKLDGLGAPNTHGFSPISLNFRL
jgi:hypothetical protein